MKPYPVIPQSEYPARWAKAQTVLKEMNLDLLLAYADDRATYGAAHARYFGNLAVHFEQVLVLFAKDRDPALLVGPETVGFARETGSIKDIRVLSEFAAEAEDYPFTKVEPLADVARGYAKGEIRRVGFAAKHLCDAKLFEAVRRAFPGAEIVPADAELEGLRAVKSEAELDVIRWAYHLANLGMEAALAAVKPGVTEREVAAKAEYAMRMGGSEGCGIDTIVASGPNSRHILARTTMRKIGENDAVLITVAPRYEGYHGACARTVIVGDPGAKTVEAIEAGIRAQNECAQMLAPGKVGSAIEAHGRDVMAKAGYGENFLYSGLHSVGVIEFEPPILGPSSATVLKPGMVVSIDIPLFEASVPGARTEDGYIITETGAEKLTTPAQLCRA